MTDQVSKIEDILNQIFLSPCTAIVNSGELIISAYFVKTQLIHDLKTAIESYGAEKLKEGFEAAREKYKVEGIDWDGGYRMGYKYPELNDYLNRGRDTNDTDK